jgi:D-glycero-beta-D-manno-heptose-7-phosphate kinase
MTARDIINGFNKKRVLIIGDLMLDRYIWGTIDRMSPEAPVPVVTVRKHDARPGGAGNVTLNISSLGAIPVLCALIGNDKAAETLKDCFQRQSISTEGLIVSSSRPTTEKTRVIAQDHHIVRIDEETDAPPSAEEEKQIMERIEKLLPSSDVIIFQDYDKGVLSENIISKTIALARAMGIPTVVDPKKRNIQHYKGVTLFKPNLKELRDGLKEKIDPTSDKQVSDAVSKLKAALSASGVMTTLSEHGVYIDYDGQQARLPAHARQITDVSGAGDTVVAVAALCVAMKLNAKQVAAYSNLAGGLVCQHVGVVPIDRGEFLREAEQDLLD